MFMEIALPRLGLNQEEEGENKEEEPKEAHDPASSSNRVNADGPHRSLGQVGKGQGQQGATRHAHGTGGDKSCAPQMQFWHNAR